MLGGNMNCTVKPLFIAAVAYATTLSSGTATYRTPCKGLLTDEANRTGYAKGKRDVGPS